MFVNMAPGHSLPPAGVPRVIGEIWSRVPGIGEKNQIQTGL